MGLRPGACERYTPRQIRGFADGWVWRQARALERGASMLRLMPRFGGHPPTLEQLAAALVTGMRGSRRRPAPELLGAIGDQLQRDLEEEL